MAGIGSYGSHALLQRDNWMPWRQEGKDSEEKDSSYNESRIVERGSCICDKVCNAVAGMVVDSKVTLQELGEHSIKRGYGCL